MLGLRHLPLQYRLPLIHGALRLLGRNRARHWARADTTAPKPGPLVLSAFFKDSTGIGRGGRLTSQALKAAGYNLIEHDLRPGFKRILQGDAKLPGHGGVWFIHANAPETLVAFLAHDPRSWADRYRIAYWAWETPKMPADWVWIADYLHEIWVPSHFVFDAAAAAFHQAGRDDLIVRLRIMPHPLPPVVAKTYLEAQQRFGLDPDVCEVLCLFDTKSSATRKNPWSVIEAWCLAFPEPATEARLTLKVSDLTGDRPTQNRLHAVIMARPDIRILAEQLSDAEMDALICACDLMISLHRSEGFGLTLAEAMAAGVGIIATGWSGNMDFMTPANARLVPVKLVPVRDPAGPYAGYDKDHDQVWAEPDVAVAAAALRELTADDSARRDLILAAKSDIRKLDLPWQHDTLQALAFNLYLPAMP